MRPGHRRAAHGESRGVSRAPKSRGPWLSAAAGLLAGLILVGGALAAACNSATEPVSEATNRVVEIATYVRDLDSIRDRIERATSSAEAAVHDLGAKPDATRRRAAARVEAAANEASATAAALEGITPPRGLEGVQADAERALARATASLDAAAADLAKRRRGLSRSHLEQRLRRNARGALSRLLATLTEAARTVAPSSPSPAP